MAGGTDEVPSDKEGRGVENFNTEQYRTASDSTVSEVLAFGYQLGGNNVFSGEFTPYSALDVHEILTGSTSSTPVDGNATANSMVVSATLSNLNWVNGQTLVLRWLDTFDNGTNALLGIDNVALSSTVPEPTSAVLVVGSLLASCLGLWIYRRRKARQLDRVLRVHS
jgi:hypothetical protein